MSLKTVTFVLLLFCSSFIYSQEDTLRYIFLGHTYEYFTPGYTVDPRIFNIDIQSYSGVWLGGDVCSESLMNYESLQYIDNIFELNKPNTHWALGNHDARNGNWIWLEELTGHKTYYTSTYKDITYIVLNSNITPYRCEQLNDQYRILVGVCDTISESSHLVLLMHHGLWEGVPGLPSPGQYAQSNLKYYNFNCNDVESTFAREIYPRLVEVKNRGVEVLCIMGDIGARTVEYESSDGIHFLGCGLQKSYYTNPEERENAATDYALVFKHVLSKKWMEWEFIDFDILSGYK